jgi:NADH:ubiquinone oxidoreductase subunit H
MGLLQPIADALKLLTKEMTCADGGQQGAVFHRSNH